MTWRIYTRKEPIWRDIAVAIIHEAPDGQSFVSQLALKTIDPSEWLGEEPWTLLRRPKGGGGREFLQAALDAAWAEGMRPTQGVEEVGALSATRAHLADMQKLVFSRLPPDVRVEGSDEIKRGPW